VEIVAGLLRHPSPISIDDSEACETFLYVFEPELKLLKQRVLCHWGFRHTRLYARFPVVLGGSLLLGMKSTTQRTKQKLAFINCVL